MKKILSFIASSSIISAPLIAIAQSIPPYQPLGENAFVNPQAFIEKMAGVAKWFGGIVLGVAVIMIIYAAFVFLTAGGSDEKITSARNYLVYALVGVAVALLAFALPALVRTFLV